MKLLSFLRNGNTGFGLVKNNGIIDLSGILGDDVRTIKKVLELDLLDLIEDMTKGKDPDFGWTDVTLIPVIPDPAKILCIGLNYAKHVACLLYTSPSPRD